jgi:hypothetical protein
LSEVIENQEKRNWLCPNEFDRNGIRMNYKFYTNGDFFNGDYMSLKYSPCYPVQKTPENENDTSLCLVDDFEPRTLDRKLQQAKAYIQNPVMQLWYNKETLNSDVSQNS